MSKNFIPVANVELSDDEIQAAVEVLKSGCLRQGGKTREFEEKFFPKSFRKQSITVPTDARALGISLARESLDTIRRQLSK